MRKFLTALVAGALLLALVPAVASAAPDCSSGVEFIGYSGNAQSGLMGHLCIAASYGIDSDKDFGNTVGPFQGSDDNNLQSFKMYNGGPNNVCIEFWTGTQFTGSRLLYKLGPTTSWWGPSGGTMPSGWNNVVSSVSVYTDEFGCG